LALGVPTVTTASKEAEQATAAPGTTIVVNQRDIQLRGYAQLTDVLRDLPGLDPVPFYFSELGTQVPVRGISGNTGIVVLLNGMRVNPPGGEAFPFRSDFSVRQAEQVEIVYGPGSTLHGPDAVSAVINVKTKAPPAGTTGEFGVDFGTNRERDLWGSFSKTFGPARQLSLTGYLDYHDSSLTRLDREYPAHWADYRSVAATRTNANGITPDREDFGLNAFVRLQVGATSLQYWHRQSRRSSAAERLGRLRDPARRERPAGHPAGNLQRHRRGAPQILRRPAPRGVSLLPVAGCPGQRRARRVRRPQARLRPATGGPGPASPACRTAFS
jgi:outer membrane receptor protein involved in Fe transport